MSEMPVDQGLTLNGTVCSNSVSVFQDCLVIQLFWLNVGYHLSFHFINLNSRLHYLNSLLVSLVAWQG